MHNYYWPTVGDLPARVVAANRAVGLRLIALGLCAAFISLLFATDLGPPPDLAGALGAVQRFVTENLLAVLGVVLVLSLLPMLRVTTMAAAAARQVADYDPATAHFLARLLPALVRARRCATFGARCTLAAQAVGVLIVLATPNEWAWTESGIAMLTLAASILLFLSNGFSVLCNSGAPLEAASELLKGYAKWDADHPGFLHDALFWVADFYQKHPQAREILHEPLRACAEQMGLTLAAETPALRPE